jgi:hypothetical protein
VLKKRNLAMTSDAEKKHKESVEQEIVKALEDLDATQSAILERFGGSLTRE